MDPPQLHAPPPPQQPPPPLSQPPYPDSPHSHTTDTLPDTTTVTTTVTTATTTATKLRLMCSYNGHIVPRPNTKSLTYAGGETRIIAISRTTTLLSDVKARLTKHLSISKPFVVKYQLPNEDLDSLISLSTDEDLENMIDEYDRLMVSGKLGRIRLFLFPVGGIHGSKSDVAVSRGDDWFFNALNGGGGGDGGGGAGVELERRFSDPVSVNCLIRLDDRDFGVNPNLGNVGNGVKVGEKTVIETNSSFGSTSSSPSMGHLNLQQVKVQVEGGGSVEEQFGQMSVGVGVGGGGGQGGGEKQGVDEGFLVISSPFSTEAVTGVARVASAGEIVSRVNSDDERSENGVGCWKQQEGQGQGQGLGQGQSGAVNVQQQMMGLNGGGGVSLQVPQQKQQLGSGELPSPESVSSDGSLSNAMSRQKPSAYQDPSGQMPNGSNKFPPSIQVQHVENRHQPQQQLHILQEQPQALQPQSLQHQQQQQPQPQAQQQYIPAAAHYVHHPPPGAVPMPAYYPMYPPPPQQQHNHPYQYAVYYVPVGQAQGYNFPGQQQPPNMGDLPISIPSNHTQAPPNPTIITTPAYNPTQNINMQTSNSEMGPGVYRTTNGPGGPPVAQQSQPQQPNHQYVGFPNTAPASGYAYELADPSHPQIYYTQPVAPALTSQYQGMTSGGPTMVVSDGSSQVSSDSVKQQT